MASGGEKELDALMRTPAKPAKPHGFSSFKYDVHGPTWDPQLQREYEAYADNMEKHESSERAESCLRHVRIFLKYYDAARNPKMPDQERRSIVEGLIAEAIIMFELTLERSNAILEEARQKRGGGKKWVVPQKRINEEVRAEIKRAKIAMQQFQSAEDDTPINVSLETRVKPFVLKFMEFTDPTTNFGKIITKASIF